VRRTRGTDGTGVRYQPSNQQFCGSKSTGMQGGGEMRMGKRWKGDEEVVRNRGRGVVKW
jgi:hypothetical protein